MFWLIEPSSGQIQRVQFTLGCLQSKTKHCTGIFSDCTQYAIKALLLKYGTKMQTQHTCGAAVAVCNSVFHFFTHSATHILPILHFRFNVPTTLPPGHHAFYQYCTSSLPPYYDLCAIPYPLLVLIVLRLCVLLLKIMVEEISKTITQYEERLRRCSYAPRLSYGRRMLAEDGGPNAMFFTVLFCDEPMACATASQCDVPR